MIPEKGSFDPLLPAGPLKTLHSSQPTFGSITGNYGTKYIILKYKYALCTTSRRGPPLPASCAAASLPPVSICSPGEASISSGHPWDLATGIRSHRAWPLGCIHLSCLPLHSSPSLPLSLYHTVNKVTWVSLCQSLHPSRVSAPGFPPRLSVISESHHSPQWHLSGPYSLHTLSSSTIRIHCHLTNHLTPVPCPHPNST